MTRVRTSLWMLVLLLATATGVVNAEDLTVVSKVTPAKGAPTTSTVYLTADAMKIDNGEVSTVVEFGSGTITQIDNKKRTYYVTSADEMRQHFAKLEEMMKSNPMMEKMLGPVSDVKVEKAGDTRDIVGYPCRKYVLTMGDHFSETLWVTDRLEVPFQYYEARKVLYAMMGPMAAKFDKMLDAMKQIKGFALASDVDAKVMGFDASSSSEAVEVKKGPVPAAVFQPPAGSKKIKSPLAR